LITGHSSSQPDLIFVYHSVEKAIAAKGKK